MVTYTTNVPRPTFGATGFVAPLESAIYAGVLADYQAAPGWANINGALNTPQGQLISTTTAIIGNVNDDFVQLTNLFDPAFSYGRYQDAIGYIYFITRFPSQSTVLQCNCVGLQGVEIVVNALIQDANGNLYQCTGTQEIGASGNVIASFACTVPGPVPVPASDGVSIYQSISGWDDVTVVSGVVGNYAETRSQFEQRRALSVSKNSLGSLPSVLGSVLAVPNIIDAFVTENVNNFDITVGGVVLNPNSLYVAAVGGLDTDVAVAIWTKKAPGCNYNGNTTVDVQDTSPGYVPPYPTYAVSFERPLGLPVVFNVQLVNSPQVPSNALALIQGAILNAFAGGDGGPRAKIGTTILASRFYAPIFALGPWVQIVSITLGSTNQAGSSFEGSVAGSVLTVSSVSMGALSIGQLLFDATGDLAEGTQVVSFGTGSGGVGTYNLNFSQTVSAEAMSGVIAGQLEVPVNINQVPTTDAPSIALTLL